MKLLLSAVDVVGPFEPSPPPLSPAPRHYRLERHAGPEDDWRTEMLSRDVVTMERMHDYYLSRGEEARIVVPTEEEMLDTSRHLALYLHERSALAGVFNDCSENERNALLKLLPPEISDQYLRPSGTLAEEEL